MEFKKLGETFVLRLETGEEIIQSMIDFCEKHNVLAGHFNGIGAANRVEISTFNVEKKQYFDKTIEGQLEITSLLGNISIKDKKPHIHCHITLGDKKFNAIAGHLNSAVVSATCEIFITQILGQIERKESKETGLFLMELK